MHKEGMDWDDLKILLAVSRAGGAKSAAELLRVSHATISRRMSELESRLNVVLVDRNGLGWEITPLGRQLADKAREMERQTIEAARIANAFSTELDGVVRVSVPTGVVTMFLATALREFRALYPQIRLIVQNEDQIIDLHSRRADLAVRFTSSPDPNLIGEQVATSAWAFYADQPWSESINEQLSEGTLPLAPLLTTNADNSIPDWAHKLFDPTCPCDFVYGFREKAELAANGFGVAMLPRIIGDQHADLIRLDRLKCTQNNQLWVLANADTRASKRIAILRKMLGDGIRALQPLLDPNAQ